MPTVKRHALVRHSPVQMFDLVNDVAGYAAFLPWCQSSVVVEQSAEVVVGKLTIHKAGITKSFTTRNTLSPHARIDITLEEGPFKRLEGHWLFENIQDQGTKVVLVLDFEFEQNWLGMMLNKVFSSIADSLVQAFCDQADQRYG